MILDTERLDKQNKVSLLSIQLLFSEKENELYPKAIQDLLYITKRTMEIRTRLNPNKTRSRPERPRYPEL